MFDKKQTIYYIFNINTSYPFKIIKNNDLSQSNLNIILYNFLCVTHTNYYILNKRIVVLKICKLNNILH